MAFLAFFDPTHPKREMMAYVYFEVSGGAPYVIKTQKNANRKRKWPIMAYFYFDGIFTLISVDLSKAFDKA